jgi:hypothetical protein
MSVATASTSTAVDGALLAKQGASTASAVGNGKAKMPPSHGGPQPLPTAPPAMPPAPQPVALWRQHLQALTPPPPPKTHEPTPEAQRAIIRELGRLKRSMQAAAPTADQPLRSTSSGPADAAGGAVRGAVSGGAEGVLELEADESDLFTWRVKLAMPEGTELHRQLCAHARGARGGHMHGLPSLHPWAGFTADGRGIAAPPSADAHASEGRAVSAKDAAVSLELTMPPDFPSAPPFVRVVSPRFAFHTGHVTIGGSLCMELLTSAGWRSDFTLESVLVQVRAALLEGGGRLDPRRAHVPYSRDEATRAFWRVARQHGWER